MPADPPTTAMPSPGSRLDQAGEWLLTLGLAATLAVTTLRLGGYLAETMVWAARAIWALGLLGGVLFVLRPRPVHWAALLPVPFLLFALASVLWIAPAKWLAWREWLLWSQMGIVFALALHFGRTRAQLWTLAGTVVALGVAGVGMAAYQRFSDPAWMMLGRTQAGQFFGRSAGMFGIPNSLAGLLEVMIPVCLVLIGGRSATAGRRLICGWLALMFLFAMVLTGSRGGWIATAVALVAWPLCVAANRKRALAGALGALALMAAALAVIYVGSEQARVRIDPFLRGDFEHTRPIIWRVGVELWRSAPWLGTGAASYNVLFDRHRPSHFRNEPDWTHNDYLNTLSDYGVVGFSLWFGAGAMILWLGWRTWRHARRTSHHATPLPEHWRWKLGLWLGCLAYAVHLGVDFHTKIPSLAWLGALVAALLLRDDPRLVRPIASRRVVVAVVAPVLVAIVAAGWRGDRLYQAEAQRFDFRRRIDKVALGQGTLDQVVPAALVSFQRATQIDPANGQAWGDLAYAITLSWHVTKGNVGAIGRRAEAAARAALACSEANAEFWVHLGVALDMQARQEEGGEAFRTALALAPNQPAWHYHYAHHLGALPGRSAEALAAVETCLALDPNNAQAKALRARLIGDR